MKSINSIINAKQKISPIWRGVSAALVVDSANIILKRYFGSEITKRISAVHFKNQTLTLACLSSTSAQEIRLRETKILNELNEKFGLNTIKKITYLN
ncbi:MAG: DciA family protein [bacterium]